MASFPEINPEATMKLTVIGFEFGKHFLAAQKLSDYFCPPVPLWYFSSFIHYFKVIVFRIFIFIFCQLHIVLGQSLPHLETQSLSLFTNPKSTLITRNHFLKSKFVCHIAWSLHVNVTEAPQTQKANVNFPPHPSLCSSLWFPSHILHLSKWHCSSLSAG